MRTTIALILAASFAASSAWAAQPPKSQDSREETASEWKARRAEIVLKARMQKSANLERLRTEKDPEKLSETILALGDSADGEVVAPLAQALDDRSKNDKIRSGAIDALLKVASSPERTKGASEEVLKNAKPRVELALRADSKILRRTAAHFLYRVGDKKAASPVITEALKDGEWAYLNTFVYHRTEGPVQVIGGMPGEVGRIDSDSLPILEKVSGKDFPENVRYRSSMMLVKAGETEKALAALEDIIVGGTDLGIRSSALSSVADIKGERSLGILQNALKIPELKSLARRMLMRRR